MAAGVLSRPAVFARGYNEKTESQGQLARRHRADPEPTEEIGSGDGGEAELAAANDSKNAGTIRANGNGVAAKRLIPPDPTQPIGSERAAPSATSRYQVQLAQSDEGESPAELIELVVQPEERRLSVLPGETLAGRYLVVEKIRHSGMGQVFKALDQRREQAGSPVPWVALKFARDGGREPATSVYLRQEFLKLSQLNHPNIVSVFDFDNDGGLDFIVMEWLEGETLAELLNRISSKRIALDKAEDIIRCVGRALAHAHAAGIVHGDVKPANIFLTESRNVKLLDFGSSGSSSSDTDTSPNWATRAYASCEVLRGEAPQPHDDVFALGVTAYGLLSGERPFDHLDASAAKEQRKRPRPLPPDAQDMWSAVDHALQFDGRDRPANAALFLHEFTDAPVDVAAIAERSQLEHIAYGAVAVAFLIALVAWTVGSVSGVPDEEQVALANADRALAAGHLVEPVNESAFDFYSSALSIAPGSTEALAGLRRVAEQMLMQARASLLADDPEAAARDLELARKVMPDHFGIAVMDDLLARYGDELILRARQTVSTNPDQAETLLNRATALVAPDDPSVLSVREALARSRANAELETLLRGIDQRILAERLTIPQGDSAVDLLHQARRIAPDDRQVDLAADRIATALLFQAMFAISNGNLAEADRYISAAISLNVRHLALARAQYELAKARHDAMRTRRNAE